MKKVTLKEVILELTPFPPKLITWANSHKLFLEALKNVYPEKFISPGVIIVHPPIKNDQAYVGDVVIGVLTYHHELSKPTFKQDFIVNKKGLDKEFVLYSRNPSGSSKYVKDINEFFAKYGKFGHSRNNHHLSLEELPNQLQLRAMQAINLANKMKIGTPQEIPQEHIDKIYREVMKIKPENRIVKQKLKD